jgi:[CysO sulfur-carrier protein]-S-L-cysteine hydrolase
MSQPYRLNAALYRQMLAQCRREAPAEACGLLGGGGSLQGDVLFPMPNLDACAESYRMDSKKVLDIMKELDERGLELNAIYHSHPATPARPSRADIEQAYMPVVYLILSLCGEEPVLRGYSIEEGSVGEIPVEIEETAGGGPVVD